MKRFSFSTFLVDDSNREAVQLCREVAELRPVEPLPALILGDDGTGKTHLLYSIVNRVRAVSAKAGLAYVTGPDLPQQVRNLLQDPAPVLRKQKSKHPAILLVDHLERFTELAGELEEIVRLFLDNGHYVLLASNTHPDRLPQLPDSFKNSLEQGQTVDMGPHTPQTQAELLRRKQGQESEAELLRQRKEIEELREMLDKKTSGEAPPESAVADLQTALEQERALRQSLEAEVESLRQQGQAPAEADEGAQAEVRELRQEIITLNEEALQAKREAEDLRAQLEESGEGGDAAHLEGQVHELQNRLAEAERQRDEMQPALEAAQQELGRLQGELEQTRIELGQTREAHANAERERDELREQMDPLRQECARLEDLLKEAQDTMASAQLERERLERDLSDAIVAADEAASARRSALDELEAMRESDSAIRSELEVLRRDFDERLEEAMRPVREKEQKAAELSAAAKTALKEKQLIRTELHAVQERMVSMAATINMLCEQIAEPDVVVEHLGAWAEPEEETDEDRQQEIEYVAAMPVMGDEEEDKEEAAPQESSGQPAELNPQAFDPDMASVLGQAGGPEPFETTNAEQPAEAQDESRPEEGEVVEEDEEIEEAGFVAAAEEPPGKAADEPATPEEPSAPGPGTEASIEQQAEPFRPIEDDEELPEAEPQAGPEDQSENLAAMQEFPAPSFSVGEETEYPVADEEETSGPGEDIPLKPSEAESLETEPEEGAAADAEERADASESDAGEEAPEESEDTGGIEVSPDAVYPLEDLEEREAGEKPQEEGEDVK